MPAPVRELPSPPRRGNASFPPPAPARRRRGGILAWLAAGLVFCSALAVLAWMLLVPVAAQERFAAATGAELRLRGLMADPFAGRATVTGWTLRASSAPAAPLLARGGAAELGATGWQAALAAEAGKPAVLDTLVLDVSELVLAPDAKGRWPLLALGAASGLPYEKNGPVGADAPRVKIRRLSIRVATVVVRDAATGRDTPVRVDWRGEYRDLDHSRPVVAALLAAAAGKKAVP